MAERSSERSLTPRVAIALREYGVSKVMVSSTRRRCSEASGSGGVRWNTSRQSIMQAATLGGVNGGRYLSWIENSYRRKPAVT
jgi:hypothetical protein